jgi:hypothetical protein
VGDFVGRLVGGWFVGWVQDMKVRDVRACGFQKDVRTQRNVCVCVGVCWCPNDPTTHNTTPHHTRTHTHTRAHTHTHTHIPLVIERLPLLVREAALRLVPEVEAGREGEHLCVCAMYGDRW